MGAWTVVVANVSEVSEDTMSTRADVGRDVLLDALDCARTTIQAPTFLTGWRGVRETPTDQPIRTALRLGLHTVCACNTVQTPGLLVACLIWSKTP